MDNHTDGGLNLVLVVGVTGGGSTALVLIIVLLSCIIIVIILKKKKTTYDMSGKVHNNRTISLCTYGSYWLLHHTIFTILVCVCNTLSKRCVYLY